MSLIIGCCCDAYAEYVEELDVLRRRRIIKIRPARIPIKATPPTVPPTIAPMLTLLLGAATEVNVEVPIGVLIGVINGDGVVEVVAPGTADDSGPPKTRSANADQ